MISSQQHVWVVAESRRIAITVLRLCNNLSVPRRTRSNAAKNEMFGQTRHRSTYVPEERKNFIACLFLEMAVTSNIQAACPFALYLRHIHISSVCRALQICSLLTRVCISRMPCFHVLLTNVIFSDTLIVSSKYNADNNNNNNQPLPRVCCILII